MKIEILYPELCTLYGDKGNMQYLKLCLPDAEFVETTLNAKPLFLTEDIDLVYMCSMSEKSQHRSKYLFHSFAPSVRSFSFTTFHSTTQLWQNYGKSEKIEKILRKCHFSDIKC